MASLAKARAQAQFREWRADPIRFVRDVFGCEPDEWQRDALLASVRGGPFHRVVMRACTGPGKSTVLAWTGWHRLACFCERGEHPKGAAVSITKENLTDNLWAELAKWQQRSELLRRAFTWTKSTIYANDHAETWFLSARSFAQDADEDAIGRTLSGLHSLYPFVLLDETGDMPKAVGKAAEQIFTGSPRDALLAAAGNPTDTAGLLFDIVERPQTSWEVITITADPDDPKRTPRVSVEHARSQIETYGRDDPWVMATILGLFPKIGLNCFFQWRDLTEMEGAIMPPLWVGSLVQVGESVKFFPGVDPWLEVWEAPRPGADYVCGGDVSEALPTGDKHSCHVLKRGLIAEQVARFAPDCNEAELGRRMVLAAKWYGQHGHAVPVAPESNAMGRATVLAIQETQYPHLFWYTELGTKNRNPRAGWHSNTPSRPHMLSTLATAVAEGAILVRSQETLDQMRTFLRSKSGKPEAAGGCHDDEVLGLAITLQMIERTQPIKEKIPAAKFHPGTDRTFATGTSAAPAWDS